MNKETRVFVAVIAVVALLAVLEGVTFWRVWFPPTPEPKHPFPTVTYFFKVVNVTDQPAPNRRLAVNVTIRWDSGKRGGFEEYPLKIDYVPQLPDPWFAPREITAKWNETFSVLILKTNMYARITLFVNLTDPGKRDYFLTVQIRQDGSVGLGPWWWS